MSICVPPRRINEIIHGKRRITADTALRLGRYLGTRVQVITKHVREVAVVPDYQRYLELSSSTQSVWQSPQGAPDLSELNLDRSRELVRPRDLV